MRDPVQREPPVLRQALAAADGHEAAGNVQEARLLYGQVLSADPGNAHAAEGLAATARRRPLVRRALTRAGRTVAEAVAQPPRRLKFRALSTLEPEGPAPRVLQPVLFRGNGTVRLGEGVQFGWPGAPGYHSGYIHVEATFPGALVEFGDRFELNNDSYVKSEGPGIHLGADGLFGAGVQIFDTDFHELDPARRRDGTPRRAPVVVERNVFVGMGVRILKGVTIGADSVIGAGAVVSSSIPAGVIAAGNPARVLREL